MVLRLHARLRALPPNVRGALWMLLGTVIWSTSDVIVKNLGHRIDPFQIALFRCFFGGLIVLPFLLASANPMAFQTRRLGGHVVRAAAGYLAMAFGWYAIVHLPLADATALSFSRPLFLVVLAVLFMGEIVRWRRWTATAAGFIGVLVMARPGLSQVDLGLVAAIGGAFCVAVVSMMIKSLAATERPATIIFYFGVLSSLLALGPALWVWRTPSLVEFALLVWIGAVGSLGQYFTIRAFRIAEATAVDPFDYTRLLFATIFGFLFFNEVPDIFTLVGAAIIVGSTFYIARREARLRHAAQSATTAPVSNPEKSP
ncbi:MAG: DMT family transporter [Alphaproteobacteria bacterium]|nr:DMT family transporter [Alphaproteobacteria bacterium]